MAQPLLGALSLLTSLLGCQKPPGAVLLVNAVDEDAAVLRYADRSGSGERVLQRLGPDGAERWQRALPTGPSEAGALDTRGAPWLVLTQAEGALGLSSVDPRTGDARWTWTSGQAEALRMRGDADTVLVYWGEVVAAIDRATGQERWRAEVPVAGARAEARPLGRGAVVLDTTAARVLDGQGALTMDKKTRPAAACAGDGWALFSDPARATWLIADAQAEPLLTALEQPITGSCGARGGAWFVPHRSPQGRAGLAALRADGSVTWTVELGEGSHVRLETAGDWPRHMPLVLEAPGGRRLVIVDTQEGEVVNKGRPSPALVRVGGTRLGEDAALWAGGAVLRVDAGSGALSSWTLLGEEGQARGQRLSAQAQWVIAADTLQPTPWSAPEAAGSEDSRIGVFGL